jgi:hypothetical protein
MVSDPSPMTFVESRSLSPGVLVEVGESEPTLEAARWGLEIATMLGRKVGDDVLSLLAACRQSVGGFGMRPGDTSPNLEATYYAIRIAWLISAHGVFDAKVGAWLRNNIFDERMTVALDSHQLFYAMRTFQLSDVILTGAERAAVLRLIDECAGPEGGFSLLPGGQPDIERTYLCVNMLEDLGEMRHRRDHDLHSSWIRSCFRQGSFYWDRTQADHSLATVYWGARTAQMLGLAVPWDAVRHRVNRDKHTNGGYGSGGQATLWHTYCALGSIQIAEQEVGRKTVTS